MIKIDSSPNLTKTDLVKIEEKELDSVHKLPSIGLGSKIKINKT